MQLPGNITSVLEPLFVEVMYKIRVEKYVIYSIAMDNSYEKLLHIYMDGVDDYDQYIHSIFYDNESVVVYVCDTINKSLTYSYGMLCL